MIFITFSAFIIIVFLVRALLLLNQKFQVKDQAKKAIVAIVREDLHVIFNRHNFE